MYFVYNFVARCDAVFELLYASSPAAVEVHACSRHLQFVYRYYTTAAVASLMLFTLVHMP